MIIENLAKSLEPLGPFIISEYCGEMQKSYTIRQISGKPIPRYFHGDLLKPFQLREGYIVTSEEAGNAVFKIPREQGTISGSFPKS
ncbi:hypothetical protein OnM2_083006 [Erysiphe neolycopersici]|uniref:Uncharacterized protein n=1 Tax=Erysiphe neolycopersici TaxID=212602 RepID=A0A420HFH6_9PEZI|nr:hypothetical protein OnM2_083006 [Erysiphe neolycopersici]